MLKSSKLRVYINTLDVIRSLDGGKFLNKKYGSVWLDQYIEGLDNDQSKMIAYGIRAASSHNTQPWLVKYSVPNFDEKMPLIATIKVKADSNMEPVDAISSSTYDAVYSEGSIDLRKT